MSSTPNNDSGETIRPQDTSGTEGKSGQTPPVGSLIIHPPANSEKSRDGSGNKTPGWEKAAVFIALGLLIVNLYQGLQTKKSADAAGRAAEAAGRSADQAKLANDFARDALTRVQRAFIAVDPVPEIQTSNDNGQQSMLFAFYLENSGTTPTRRLEAHINWAKGTKPLPKDFTFPDAPDREGVENSNRLTPVIGPKARVPLIAGPISREFIEKLYRREVRLYVYGWARYNDIFDKTPRHITRFCYELVSAGIARTQSGEQGQGLRTVITGTRFNCYDEEC